MASTFHLPAKIIFGVGSVTRIGGEASQLGLEALVVTYPDIRKIGLLDRFIESLRAKGVDVSVFDKVEPNPRSSTVDKGTSIARDNDVHLIIGLGGGSAMLAASLVPHCKQDSDPSGFSYPQVGHFMLLTPFYPIWLEAIAVHSSELLCPSRLCTQFRCLYVIPKLDSQPLFALRS